MGSAIGSITLKPERPGLRSDHAGKLDSKLRITSDRPSSPVGAKSAIAMHGHLCCDGRHGDVFTRNCDRNMIDSRDADSELESTGGIAPLLGHGRRNEKVTVG